MSKTARASLPGIALLFAVITFVVLCTGTAYAQQKEASYVPGYTIVPSAVPVVVAQMPTPAMDGSLTCTADGSLVVHLILDPTADKPHENPRVLNTISRTGVVQGFDLSRAVTLTQVEPQDYAIGDSGADFLLWTAYKGNGKDQAWTAPSAYHVVHFDRQGNYRGEHLLDAINFQPMRIGSFHNGDLLIFGIDRMNARPVLARYSPNGGSYFYYRPEKDFAINNKSLPSPFAPGKDYDRKEVDLAKLEGAVSYSQITHYKDSLLLFQMATGAPIFQVFEDGSTRVIPVPVVDGFIAQSLITSNGPLYISYRKIGTGDGVGDNALILEVSPTTGDILKKLHPSDGMSIWDVACAYNGEFSTLNVKGDHEFRIFDAKLQSSTR